MLKQPWRFHRVFRDCPMCCCVSVCVCVCVCVSAVTKLKGKLGERWGMPGTRNTNRTWENCVEEGCESFADGRFGMEFTGWNGPLAATRASAKLSRKNYRYSVMSLPVYSWCSACYFSRRWPFAASMLWLGRIGVSGEPECKIVSVWFSLLSQVFPCDANPGQLCLNHNRVYMYLGLRMWPQCHKVARAFD